MAQWVRLCGLAEAPEPGGLNKQQAAGRELCVVNLAGTLRAVDNVCPHRSAPLHEGWLEGEQIVCPWHSWTFDFQTGACEWPRGPKVDVFPLTVEGDDVLVDVEGRAAPPAAADTLG